MTRREIITMAAAVLASELASGVLPEFSAPVTMPKLPLVLYYEIGAVEWTNGQAFMNLTLDAKQFKDGLEQLKAAVRAGLISHAELQERLDSGTLFRLVLHT
jgi:hypothetical protein